jgi:hypothetical protein
METSMTFNAVFIELILGPVILWRDRNVVNVMGLGKKGKEVCSFK